MRRREFIRLLGGAALASPLAARAQQPMPVIGLLSQVSFGGVYANRVVAFHQGVEQTGFVEGKNMAIEYRSAEARFERLPSLAADLVRRQVAVIVAFGGSLPVRAAQSATTTIPIVFAVGIDALQLGLVASYNRPDSNITGISFNNTALAPKRLELLRELVPDARIIGFFLDPNSALFETELTHLPAVARSIGRDGVVFRAGTEHEIDFAFAAMIQRGVGALVVSNAASFISRSELIVGLAARYRLPTMYAAREAVAAGGLISYAPKADDLYRQAGVYAGLILKGEKPANLPVLQPTKFEMVINLKTARTLGLTVPLTLQVAADEVIE